MLLKEICVLDVACCTRNTSIVAAAQLMRLHHTGDLVVVDDPGEDRVPVGIITDRDIVVEVLGKELDPYKTTVGDIMSSRLVIAGSSEDTADAIERMRVHGVRRVPVVDDAGGVVGIITLDDLLKVHAAQATALVDIVSKEQTHEQRARR
jgi:CBS domain-containing protein